MLYIELKRLQPEIKELTKLGLVDSSWLRNIRIYERYLELKEEKHCNYCCYGFIAGEENISWSSVKKIVKKLSS